MTRIGKFVWREIATPNIDKTVEFYKNVFGWGKQNMGMEENTYTMFTHEDKQIAGVVPAQWFGNHTLPHWLSYLNVDDVDQAVNKIEQQGGHVRTPATDIPNVGRFAIVQDPIGAIIAPFKSATPPENPDDDIKMNEFAWTELHTKELKKALTFYQELVHWQDNIMKSDQGEYHVMVHQGGPKNGEAGMMENQEVKQSHWLPYVFVEHVDKTADKVEKNGGTLLVGPIDIPEVGRFIVFQDNVGATLAAITFIM